MKKTGEHLTLLPWDLESANQDLMESLDLQKLTSEIENYIMGTTLNNLGGGGGGNHYCQYVIRFGSDCQIALVEEETCHALQHCLQKERIMEAEQTIIGYSLLFILWGLHTQISLICCDELSE